MGILAIVFAAIGLLVTFASAFGYDEELQRHSLTHEQLGGFGTWVLLAVIPGLGLFALHLTAGILSLRYSRAAPIVMTIYGVAALLAVDCLAAPWPVVVLVLMNLPGARAACRRP